jgi:hypothetical protein
MDAGIYIWMPTGIYEWMLWPHGRGIYPQMPPLRSGFGTVRVPRVSTTARSYRNSHAFRSDSTCGPPCLTA